MAALQPDAPTSHTNDLPAETISSEQQVSHEQVSEAVNASEASVNDDHADDLVYLLNLNVCSINTTNASRRKPTMTPAFLMELRHREHVRIDLIVNQLISAKRYCVPRILPDQRSYREWQEV